MAKAPQKEKADASPLEGDAGQPNKKKKLILIVGLAIALVAVSIGGTVATLKILSPAAPTGEEDAEVEEAKPTLAPAIYMELTPNFTINFSVNGRQRYLQASVTVMHRDPALEPLLKLHMPAVRNGLVMLFSNKKFEELQTPEGKEKLKAEALEIINAQLKKEQEALVAATDDEDEEDEEKQPIATVEEVLFTNFVMQ